MDFLRTNIRVLIFSDVYKSLSSTYLCKKNNKLLKHNSLSTYCWKFCKDGIGTVVQTQLKTNILFAYL